MVFDKLTGEVPHGWKYIRVGPDNKLYAATLTGKILRFNILPDGTLGTFQTINSVVSANGGLRTIIGLKFDPSSTADNLKLWITNNYFWNGQSPAQDWSGKITLLSGPDLGVVQDYVVGLPRSIRDHMTNGLAFKPGEPNMLYITQGSMSSTGAADPAWGNVPEHLLNAAVLKLDLSKINRTTLPLNVKTEDDGAYNPYAAGAPLTIFGSGVRNAYLSVRAHQRRRGGRQCSGHPCRPEQQRGLPEPQRRAVRQPRRAGPHQRQRAERLSVPRRPGRLLRPPQPDPL